MTVQTTEFQVRHDDGPPVTAKKTGHVWSFSWPGRMNGHTAGSLVDCSYDDAVRIATVVAEELAELEPARQDVIRKQEGLAEWVDAQREPTD